MKYAKYILLFLCLAGCKQKTGPVPYYSSKFINIGSIRLNKAYHGTITLKNTGDDELKLLQVSSDCECTVIKGYKERVAPNESTTIRFELTPHLTGYDQQNIFIKNNSQKEGTILIAIRANVEF